jgi:tetratricopeptide (TPR) repeat protein
VVNTDLKAAQIVDAGIAHRDAGRVREAREAFESLRSLFPASETPEVLLGTVALACHEVDNAVAHYRRALQVNPRSAFAWAHLAQALIFRKEKETAYLYCRRAIELDPNGECGKFARSVMQYADAVSYR